MPRRSDSWRFVRETADSQLGLITARQLAEIGVHSATVHRRLVGGMWTRVLPGVHLVDGGHPSRRQRELAALLYAGSPSALTGTTALRRYGVRSLHLQDVADDEPDRPEPVHLLVPHDRRRLSTGYVRVERTRRFPDEVVRRHGVVLVPLARAVGDAARRLRRDTDASALVSEVVQRGLVGVVDLEAELAGGSRRGSAFFRRALAPVSRGARSAPESDLMRLIDEAAIPSVFYNAVLVDAAGVFVASCDAWLDDVGLAIEVDSVQYHAGPEGFASTVRRNARYTAAGVLVHAVLPTDIRDHPQRVLADLLRARESAASRPRPEVYMDRHASPSSGREGWRWGA